ncbi:SDR family oxidoreductase [Candidatus Micrarchaeota archaeon]|nr:SDR family oxidoreductase [Candidatus Micrarchaeota archaeon]MBU2477147.1 SDR family oxidoreductase [Candidatus Micrarchaeota archaeon]
MKKVLVIGASGFLGTALMPSLKEKFDVIGTFFGEKKEGLIELDLNDSFKLDKVLNEVFPEIIILAAAETNVDAYESNPEISENQINSAQQITNWCDSNNSFLVFFSTDSVFDGTKAPYNESDDPNPLNDYSKNKLEIEKIIKKLENHLILRTSFLYGLPIASSKFVGLTITKLLNKEKVFAVTDWKRTPTLTKDFALALIQLIEKNQKGLFHVAGTSSVSAFEMALAIAKEFNAEKNLIKKIKGKELNLPAVRPLNSSLNISKLQSLGVKMSSLEQGLKFIHEKIKEK